ncbi:MAG: hypothetical protein R3F19_18100 [Verrucomicrobiales bacterium]
MRDAPGGGSSGGGAARISTRCKTSQWMAKRDSRGAALGLESVEGRAKAVGGNPDRGSRRCVVFRAVWRFLRWRRGQRRYAPPQNPPPHEALLRGGGTCSGSLRLADEGGLGASPI